MIRKKTTTGTLVAIAWSLLAAPAGFAMDCRQASAPVEHAICSDRQLRAADAAMGDAYARLLKTVNDADIRTMLIDGQKRWLAQRDRLFDRRLASADKDRQRAVMLSAMQDRTQTLAERPLITIAQEQRKFVARYTGGPFAGFETSCDFLPVQESYVYGCFARRQYQHNDRVCVVDAYWATGSVYEKRSVADIVDGRPKVIATCSSGGVEGDTACPGTGSSNARWNVQPKKAAALPGSSLPKIDAEAGPDDDTPWLRTCLTDRRFPLADPTSDGGGR